MPESGRWTGGWGDEADVLGVEACRTAKAGSCVVLSSSCGCYPRSQADTTIGGWFTGWKLYAFDLRRPAQFFGPDADAPVPAVDPLSWDFSAVGGGYGQGEYRLASQIPPITEAPTLIRSAPLGPVTGPPRPQVKLVHHLVMRGARTVVARLSCTRRCTVLVTTPTARPAIARRTMRAGRNIPLVLTRQQLREAGSGLRVGSHPLALAVDDGPLISWTGTSD